MDRQSGWQIAGKTLFSPGQGGETITAALACLLSLPFSCATVPFAYTNNYNRHMPCRSGALIDLPSSTCEASVRALSFDLQGQWLMAAGDDKIVRVWQLSGMTLRCQWCVMKVLNADSNMTC